MRIIYEMSRFSNIREMDACIWVDPSSSRNGHYFKLYNRESPEKATRLSRIDFDAPKYIIHRDRLPLWKLDGREKKDLINFLDKQYPEERHTNWEHLVFLWNSEYLSQNGIDILKGKFFDGSYNKGEKYEIKNPNYIQSNIPRPDYMKLGTID